MRCRITVLTNTRISSCCSTPLRCFCRIPPPPWEGRGSAPAPTTAQEMTGGSRTAGMRSSRVIIGGGTVSVFRWRPVWGARWCTTVWRGTRAWHTLILTLKSGWWCSSLYPPPKTSAMMIGFNRWGTRTCCDGTCGDTLTTSLPPSNPCRGGGGAGCGRGTKGPLRITRSLPACGRTIPVPMSVVSICGGRIYEELWIRLVNGFGS
mmetsp:Transcript_22702/g.27777  ORF Transcript_22702/g.27777 Transcript_22702/m.27777 type:complete len:206 (-) Transcript_22702:422-1039(-)